jgi:hypothetical protein
VTIRVSSSNESQNYSNNKKFVEKNLILVMK